MPKYVVQFATPNGKIGRETVEADSQRAAVARIEGDGHTPIHVQSSDAKAADQKAGRAGRRIQRIKGGKRSRRALLDFTHQMTAVAESGIPIIAGLRAVRDQTGNTQLRQAASRVVSRIEGGRTLAEAIGGEPDTFPELYSQTLAAGEVAGKVPEVLSSLARYQEQESETRAQIKSAMTYPAIVVVSLVWASAVMLIFVVPQFADLFDKFGGQLPMPTRILMAISEALVNHFLLVALGLVGSYLALRSILRYRVVREWIDDLVLKLPVFGDLLIGIYMVRFIELLSLLMDAALPIIQSLRVTADSMTNESLRKDIRRIARSVEGGRSLTEAFAETRWLTPLVKRMLAIGEQAGRTEQIFDYLKKFYADQTQRGIKLLSTLIEPAMVTGLAAIVLFFALAIFLPMWKLLKLVGAS